MPAQVLPVLAQTQDWDEGLRMSGTYFYPGTIRSLRARPTVDLRVLQNGAVTAGLVSIGSETWIDVPVLETGYHVNVALRGAFETHHDGRRAEVTAAQASLHTPDAGARLRGWRTGTEQLLAIKLDRDALELELRQLLGRDFIGSIRLKPSLDLRRGPGAQWLQLASAATHGLGDGAMLVNSQANALMVSSLMSGLLLAADHQFRGELDAQTSASPPAMVRRAVDYIQNHAYEALTLPKIAEAVGSSVRALQEGFRTHLDTTPRRYLVQVRLARVRRDLLVGDPETTSVSLAASFWGFTHVGRFASLYRDAFGELPSVTLRGG